MLFMLSFVFSAVWALFAMYMVKNSPKTCWAAIVLMSVLIYYLY